MARGIGICHFPTTSSYTASTSFPTLSRDPRPDVQKRWSIESAKCRPRGHPPWDRLGRANAWIESARRFDHFSAFSNRRRYARSCFRGWPRPEWLGTKLPYGVSFENRCALVEPLHHLPVHGTPIEAKRPQTKTGFQTRVGSPGAANIRPVAPLRPALAWARG